MSGIKEKNENYIYIEIAIRLMTYNYRIFLDSIPTMYSCIRLSCTVTVYHAVSIIIA